MNNQNQGRAQYSTNLSTFSLIKKAQFQLPSLPPSKVQFDRQQTNQPNNQAQQNRCKSFCYPDQMQLFNKAVDYEHNTNIGQIFNYQANEYIATFQKQGGNIREYDLSKDRSQQSENHKLKFLQQNSREKRLSEVKLVETDRENTCLQAPNESVNSNSDGQQTPTKPKQGKIIDFLKTQISSKRYREYDSVTSVLQKSYQAQYESKDSDNINQIDKMNSDSQCKFVLKDEFEVDDGCKQKENIQGKTSHANNDCQNDIQRGIVEEFNQTDKQICVQNYDGAKSHIVKDGKVKRQQQLPHKADQNLQYSKILPNLNKSIIIKKIDEIQPNMVNWGNQDALDEQNSHDYKITQALQSLSKYNSYQSLYQYQSMNRDRQYSGQNQLSNDPERQPNIDLNVPSQKNQRENKQILENHLEKKYLSPKVFVMENENKYDQQMQEQNIYNNENQKNTTTKYDQQLNLNIGQSNYKQKIEFARQNDKDTKAKIRKNHLKKGESTNEMENQMDESVESQPRLLHQGANASQVHDHKVPQHQNQIISTQIYQNQKPNDHSSSNTIHRNNDSSFQNGPGEVQDQSQNIRKKKRTSKMNQKSSVTQNIQKQVRNLKAFDEDKCSGKNIPVMSTNIEEIMAYSIPDATKPHPSTGVFKSGRWSKDEHFRFLVALKIYGKEWKKVQEHVGSRTSTQARSHAQKFFNKLDKRGQTLKQFLESLDINNLEDHYIMSDLEEENNGTNVMANARKKNKTLLKNKGTNSQNKSLISINELQGEAGIKDQSNEQSNQSPQNNISESSELVIQPQEVPVQTQENKQFNSIDQTNYQQLGQKANLSDDLKNINSSQIKQELNTSLGHQNPSNLFINSKITLDKNQYLGKRTHSKSFCQNNFQEPLPPNSGDSMTRTDSRHINGTHVIQNDNFKSSSAVTIPEKNGLGQSYSHVANHHSSRNIQADFNSHVASNASNVNDSNLQQQIQPHQMFRYNSQNFGSLSNADANNHQDLNFDPFGAPQTPSMKPNQMGMNGYFFDYHQSYEDNSKIQKANSLDEFGMGILDQHDDDPLNNNHDYHKPDIMLDQSQSRKILTPKMYQPSIHAIFPLESYRKNYNQNMLSRDVDHHDQEMYEIPNLLNNNHHSFRDLGLNSHHIGVQSVINPSKSQIVPGGNKAFFGNINYVGIGDQHHNMVLHIQSGDRCSEQLANDFKKSYIMK